MMTAGNHDRKSRLAERFKNSWTLGRPVSTVNVDMGSKKEIQDFTFELFVHKDGLPKARLKKLLSEKWPPEKWNLLSVVLQTLFEDHPDVPKILAHIETIGAFPWKKNPM